MSRIFVCPLSQLEPTLQQSQAQWMISLSSPGGSSSHPSQITSGHLCLEFNDIDRPRQGLIAPDKIHIAELLNFLDLWNWQGDLVIHCWMGISRSTAAACIALARYTSPCRFDQLAKTLRRASPVATPNPLMIAIADELLACGGSLRQSISSIGRGDEASEGKPFVLERLL